MIIKLWPDLVDWELSASVSGDVITINGQQFDFSPLGPGQRLPGSAIDSEYFIATEFVERKGKTLYVTLRFPVSPGSPEEFRNPDQHIVIDARKGPVKFPDASPIEDEHEERLHVGLDDYREPEEPTND